jgi:hypothetical protein
MPLMLYYNLFLNVCKNGNLPNARGFRGRYVVAMMNIVFFLQPKLANFLQFPRYGLLCAFLFYAFL